LIKNNLQHFFSRTEMRKVMETKTSSLSPHVTIFQIESSGINGRSSTVPVRDSAGSSVARWGIGWRSREGLTRLKTLFQWVREADLSWFNNFGGRWGQRNRKDGPWMMFLLIEEFWRTCWMKKPSETSTV